jgi:hypothetical protein
VIRYGKQAIVEAQKIAAALTRTHAHFVTVGGFECWGALITCEGADNA